VVAFHREIKACVATFDNGEGLKFDAPNFE
jgi:hypothetical protein